MTNRLIKLVDGISPTKVRIALRKKGRAYHNVKPFLHQIADKTSDENHATGKGAWWNQRNLAFFGERVAGWPPRLNVLAQPAAGSQQTQRHSQITAVRPRFRNQAVKACRLPGRTKQVECAPIPKRLHYRRQHDAGKVPKHRCPNLRFLALADSGPSTHFG